MTGADSYAMFAAIAFGVPVAAITEEQRTAVKRATYFVAYGGDHAQAARELGVPLGQLEAAIDAALPPVDMAVIASDGSEDGMVLWSCGDSIAIYTKDESPFVSDLRLSRPPAGISIWEGAIIFGGEMNETVVPVPRGRYRLPTEAEWVAIREGRSPWEEEPAAALDDGPTMW